MKNEQEGVPTVKYPDSSFIGEAYMMTPKKNGCC